MIDWTKSMEQIFEYYEVDPNTWKDKSLLKTVKSCTISRDDETDTLGSATIDITEMVGECYVRIYLVTIQNGVREMHPLGTFLVQTPSSTFDGKVRTTTMDAYTPLIELKENDTPLGYALLKDTNIMSEAYRIARENCRAPIIQTDSDMTLKEDFVANVDEKWISYISAFIAQAKYKLGLDELGKILFLPEQKTEELQPVHTFDDGNSSILYPETTLKHDLYGIPNVVEVICDIGTEIYQARVVNDDPNSPTSTIRRGREIKYTDSKPTLSGYPTKEQVDEYAENLLKSLSSVEYQVTFTHGYYPVRLGDCVRLNYTKADLVNIKAKVIRQSIKCEPGCPVTTTAVFTTKLWK